MATNKISIINQMPNQIILTEEELLTAIKYRYYTGAQLLYDRYAATLHKVIYCSVRDRALADEVLAETILKVWNTIDDFYLQDNRLLLWMCGIARSLAQEKLRSAHVVELAAPRKARKQKQSRYNHGLNAQQLAIH